WHKRLVNTFAARDLVGWRADQLARGLQRASIRRTSAIVKSCLRQAADLDPSIDFYNLSKGLEKRQRDSSTQREVDLSDAQVALAVSACYAHDPDLGLLAEVMSACGARPVQIARLRVRHLKRDHVQMPKSFKGVDAAKGFETFHCPLPPGLIKRLQASAA